MHTTASWYKHEYINVWTLQTRSKLGLAIDSVVFIHVHTYFHLRHDSFICDMTHAYVNDSRHLSQNPDNPWPRRPRIWELLVRMASLETGRGCVLQVCVLSGAPNPFTNSGAPNPFTIFELHLGRIKDVFKPIGLTITRCTLHTMHTYRWRGCGAGIDGHSRIDGTKRREVDKDRFHLTWRDTSYQSCSRNRRGCDGVQCMGHVQEARVQGNDSKSPTPRTRRIRQTCRGTQPKIGRLYVRMAIGVRTWTFDRRWHPLAYGWKTQVVAAEWRRCRNTCRDVTATHVGTLPQHM